MPVRSMASSDNLEIKVTGKQGHGGMPWHTVDPITTSAQIVNGLQTIVSRKANLMLLRRSSPSAPSTAGPDPTSCPKRWR